MPVVEQHTREESHVTSSSTTTFQKSTVVETSHVTQVVSSDGGGESRHTASAATSSQVQVAPGQPVIEVHASRQQVVRQEGDAPPSITAKVSLLKKEGDVVTQQISQDASSEPLTPPIKKFVVQKKKSSPARFVSPMQGVITKEDQPIELECLIDGYPDPVVSWTHNGGNISEDAEVKTHLNKTSLSIPKISQRHAGQYTCFIENDAGSAQCTCDVIVKKTQFPPVISKRLQPAVIGVNERLHLEIDVTGTPTPEVAWSKDGHPITRSDRITVRSEGTRQILVIVQAEPSDSGRYGAKASNPAGRAESLADVMVTPLILDKAPRTHKVSFTDMTDEAKKNIECVEEGHVKSIKRAIEEVADEAPPSPVKVLKSPPPPPPFEPSPSASPPEVVRPKEPEVKAPPGKLTQMWPPPASKVGVASKIDTSVEIKCANVSSIISTFSAISEEEQEAFTSHSAPIVHQPKPQMASMETDVSLEAELEPEYSFVPEQEEPPQEVEMAPQEVEMAPQEIELVPEPEPEFLIVEPPEPEVKIEREVVSELKMVRDYQRVSAPLEGHKILSPVPEVVPEPAPTPEPPRIVTPEPPKILTPEPPKIPILEPEPAIIVPQEIEQTPEDPIEPKITKEVKTETSSVESSFFESKKSMSKTSYSTVETKVYTTGITSPPQGQPTVNHITAVPVEVVPEPEPELLEYYVPETEQVIEFVPTEASVVEPPAEIPLETEEKLFTASSMSSTKSQMQTMYVSSSDLQTKVYAPVAEEQIVPEVLERKSLQPLIMPEPMHEEYIVVEEAVKPPMPPDAKEKKPSSKKKRETVIQLAKRLEENIVPMSPDEVPGGIRMFPSPKQPSTPVREVPTPTPETQSTEDLGTEKFPVLEPFPFSVEEGKPRRERPRSLHPPWPSKFVPGAFTDSEYESDMEGDHRIQIKKIKFEVPEKAARPHSVAMEALPPSAFDTPPTFEGGMRPDIIKLEEKVVQEKPKKAMTVAPKKKTKVVEKFLAFAGEKAEQEVVKPVPRKLVKKHVEPPVVVQESISAVETKKIESQPPPQVSGGSFKETKSMSSSFESKTHVTSMSYQSHQSKVTHEVQQIPSPAPVVLVPEPEPEIVLKPEPAPVYEYQPEPEPVYEQPPVPVYEAPPPPVYEAPPEPAPVYVIQPEPEPVYVHQPEPEPAPVFEHVPESAPVPVVDLAPGFRPVRAPAAAPKVSHIKSAPAPPPPFDMALPVIKPVVKPEVIPVQIPQEPVSKGVVHQVSKKSVQTFKKESKSVTVDKSVKVQKTTNVAWPPTTQEVPATSVKIRSQSAERPRVTEAAPLPVRPHEAPPAVYWFSNITLEEKRKAWPQTIPQQQLTSSTIIESSTKTSKQMMMESKQSTQTTQNFRQPVQAINAPVKPKAPVQPIVPKIQHKKEDIFKAPAPPIEFPSVDSIPMPPLEPFPFKVGPEKPRKPRGNAPGMPSRFIPGSFTESEYESDYDSMSSFSRMYVSDSEATGYKPMNLKMKKGRTKKAKHPSPPPPSSFGLPAFVVKPIKLSASDIDSDIPTSRETTPLPEPFITQIKHRIHTVKTLATQILPENKPIMQPIVQQKPRPTAPKTGPVVPPKPAPVVPVVFPVVVPQPVQQHIPPAVVQSSSVSKEQVIHKSIHEMHETGVKNVRKLFQNGGPPPMPQGVIRMQTPSPVRAPAPCIVRPVAPVYAPVPPSIASPVRQPSARVIPVAIESNAVESFSSSTHTKGKPTSPKAKNKAEPVQKTSFELEESGYAADTEGTLPRRSMKTTNAQNSSNFTSSSSFSKSESFMSSSFSKSESKSFSDSQMGKTEVPTFPVNSPFPAGSGFPTDGSFPSASFPSIPATSLGQNSSFSSSFKSSESKSSQMYTSRSEEVHEEKRGGEQPRPKEEKKPKFEGKKPKFEEKKPKFEEFRKETRGGPGSSGPFSEDTYYAMRDESDETTGTGRTKKKVDFKSETHIEVMSDKKVEVFESSSVDVSPKPTKKPFKEEHKFERKIVVEPKIEKPRQVSKPFQSMKETPKPTMKPTATHEKTHTETSKTVSEMSEKKKHAATSYMYKKTVETSMVDGNEAKKHVHPAESKMKVIQMTNQQSMKKEPLVKPKPQMPKVEPLRSTGLVKEAVIRQEKEELDLKPFPFKAEPSKPKKPRGAPPPHPIKFVKGEFYESDYDSDFEGRIPPKWKASESDAEDQYYDTVKAPPGKHKVPQRHAKSPTPPTTFDRPPHFEGPPRPKIDFPESEPEPEREMSPEFILPEKVEVIKRPEPPKIVPKEPKIFKSQPQKPKPPPRPRSPSPEIKPGSPPVEGYAPPPKPAQPAPFSNAIGVESTKITKIADSSAHHQRFVTMQQTTRVIKFGDSQTTTMTTETQEEKAPELRGRKVVREQKPLPPLEPFPFSPDPPKFRKERGGPPPKPQKFKKGEFTESDYESDYEGHPKPKWQPPDSDSEDPYYKKIKPNVRLDRTPSKTRERTPTPPTVFDTPPESGGLWRPVIEPPEIELLREPSPEVVVPKEPPTKFKAVKKILPKTQPKPVQSIVRPQSPPLPPPGTPPEVGVIMQEYVVDKVDLQSRVKAPPMKVVQTYEDKPYTKVTERTEKTYTNIKLQEEVRMKKEKRETKKTVVTEFEHAPPKPLLLAQTEMVVKVQKTLDLKPLPFKPDKEKPKRERGPPPSKPHKFVKGEFYESDYDSDYEGRIRPKWQPPDSDAEDPEYTTVKAPPKGRLTHRRKERVPTPPNEFEVPPSSGGPLRPTIEPLEKQEIILVREPSPEVVIPKVKVLPVTKTPKIIPKSPALRAPQPQAPPPRAPTPPLPEPGPQPEIGYAPVKIKRTEEEDVHIKMIQRKIETKKGYQIDIDVTDIYDFVSESEHDKTDIEASKLIKPFPKLEPFPYEPDPSRPKRQRGPPPPHPKKFMKGEFRGSDYESDYDSPIAPKWQPLDSEGEEHAYRRVAPPAGEIVRQRGESSGKEPSPPSKFDQPPHFEGPPRPVIEPSDLPRRERRESLEEYSIPRFPKVEFKPFELEDDQVIQPQGGVTTDTETETETYTKAGIDKKFVKSTQKVVGHQFDDMSQTFRHKAQRFAEQLVTEVFAAREGSVPAEPAGEPPSIPEELKIQEAPTESPKLDTSTKKELSPSTNEPQAYRDESRVSEFGTKHIDPDTGLIYFKYDFGYEFGVILPGEAKKVDKKSQMNGDHSTDIPIPVLHETTDKSQKPGKQSTKNNGHVHHLEAGHPRQSSGTASDAGPGKHTGTDHVSPQPSDFSETDPSARPFGGKRGGATAGVRGTGRPPSAGNLVPGRGRVAQWATLPDSLQKRRL